MSNGDDTERDPDEPASSAPSDRGTETSIASVLEASLQAGLRSLSDGLETLVEENTGDRASSRPGLRPRPSAGRNRDQDRRSAERKRRKRARETASEECLIDTRLTDDVFVVIADMPGASEGDISVGITPSSDELVISKTGTVVGRVDLPWTAPETKHAWFKNGILEVYLQRQRNGSDSDDGG